MGKFVQVTPTPSNRPSAGASPKTLAAELLALERAGWDALSTSGAAATAFYDWVLAAEVLMLLPGGMVLDDRATVVASMGGGDPWTGYELHDERVVQLGPDAAIVAYRATAHRRDDAYDALFASTYARHDGTWQLAAHQQTPI